MPGYLSKFEYVEVKQEVSDEVVAFAWLQELESCFLSGAEPSMPKAARELGIPRETFRDIVKRAEERAEDGIGPAKMGRPPVIGPLQSYILEALTLSGLICRDMH